MKILLGAVLLSFGVIAHRHEIVEDFIDDINSKQNLWTAGINFHNRHFRDLRGLLGSKKLPESVSKKVPVMSHDVENLQLPEFFDAREKWPECESIGKVRDQSACDSCWVMFVFYFIISLYTNIQIFHF